MITCNLRDQFDTDCHFLHDEREGVVCEHQYLATQQEIENAELKENTNTLWGINYGNEVNFAV